MTQTNPVTETESLTKSESTTTTNRVTKTRRMTKTKRSALVAAVVMLLPAVVLLIMLRLVPLGEALSAGFTDRAGEFTWTVLERTVSDPGFQGSLIVTLWFGLLINPFQIALALALAVLLTRRIPLVGAWRTLILLPVAIPQVVSAVIWAVAMRPEGPLNGILNVIGIPSVPWLISPDFALYSIIIVCSWVGVGYWMMFLVAGINEISPSLYEAAEIDGAGAWARFWFITLPGLRRQLLFVLVANTVSNFLIFAPVRVLTQGGPQGSTDLIMHNIFERAFVLGDLDSASVGTLILVMIVVVIVAIQFALLPGRK